ncbi:MAG: hypothetical protein PVJ57_12065 [Phycisphaerae bacterium]
MRPIRRSSWPAYPTALQVRARPGLRRRHQPAAGRANRELAVAAGLLASAQLAGCDRSAATPRSATLGPEAPAVVAPLFLHGKGRGAEGCVVMTPPTFLSEEEARQIISEELARSGIEATQEDVEFAEVRVPRRYIRYSCDEDRSNLQRNIVESVEEAQVLSVDFVDVEHQVAVEFVSFDDFHGVGGPIDGSTLVVYDLRETASYLRSQVESTTTGTYIGIFYDPATDPSQFTRWAELDGPPSVTTALKRTFQRHDDEREQLAAEEAERLLRQQVRDFIEWLKGQGVI